MFVPLLQRYPTAILANGSFPAGRDALRALHEAANIVCCDGAVAKLLTAGLLPAAVVGDMDSLPPHLQRRFARICHRISEQETNDLTKAVNFCIAQNLMSVTILGATGEREDHTLGNISLLAEYAQHIEVQCITDYGVFVAVRQSAEFESFAGQQVSIFSLDPSAIISSEGLKYPLRRQRLSSWWQGTLNEAAGKSFSLHFTDGNLLIYRNL